MHSIHAHSQRACSHDHDHDHDISGAGPQDNLFQYIDRPNVVALNATTEGPNVIKPWHERMDEAVVSTFQHHFAHMLRLQQSLESDADDQL